MPLPLPDVLAAKRHADASKTLLLKHATAHLAIVGKINVCLRHKKSILQQRMSLLQSVYVSICFWSATLLLADFFLIACTSPCIPLFRFSLILLLLASHASCIIYIPHLSDMSADFSYTLEDQTALPAESAACCLDSCGELSREQRQHIQLCYTRIQ